MFFFRARAEKGIARHTRDLFDTRIVCAKGWDIVIFDWFGLSMRIQGILDSLFACSDSAPTRGGKKGEFRDWTTAMQIICPRGQRKTKIKKKVKTCCN